MISDHHEIHSSSFESAAISINRRILNTGTVIILHKEIARSFFANLLNECNDEDLRCFLNFPDLKFDKVARKNPTSNFRMSL